MGTVTSSTPPGQFVKSFYDFALMIGGVLAFGAIVYGGVLYAASMGNPSRQSEGKEWIKSALLGLLLLAGAYLVLYTINPDLVNLSLPTLTAINIATSCNISCPSGFSALNNGNACVCEDASGNQGCGGGVMGTVKNSCGSQQCCPIQANQNDPVTYGCFSNCNQAPQWSVPNKSQCPVGVAAPACGGSVNGPCYTSKTTTSPNGSTCIDQTVDPNQECCDTAYSALKILGHHSYQCE
jgi:hypothetical protein